MFGDDSIQVAFVQAIARSVEDRIRLSQSNLSKDIAKDGSATLPGHIRDLQTAILYLESWQILLDRLVLDDGGLGCLAEIFRLGNSHLARICRGLREIEAKFGVISRKELTGADRKVNLDLLCDELERFLQEIGPPVL